MNDLPTVKLEDLRADAFNEIDRLHSRFLSSLTGDATNEERSTWKVKEDAALAVVAGTASQSQISMLQMEADGSQIDVSDLAAHIVKKSELFHTLIGKASALRGQTKGAVAQATAKGTTLRKASASIKVIFSKVSVEIQEAVRAFENL